ncbi:MAG: hydrogenase expression/formation protein HypE [Elusimicrobiales bacterium]|nr:hydrogenase expression/formation protein HypE [Elusimicrobiales bacterium]
MSIKSKNILLGHGSGGKLTNDLINDIFIKKLSNKILSTLEDSAVIKNNKTRIAMTTDSYVVDPIFFPGGDIGRLCVCGTVNDISVSGATICGISLGVIIEEGLDISILERIVESIKKTSKEAGVGIVTGDTKVVEKGKVDKIFINTAGVGFFDKDIDFSYKNVKKGDVIIINGEVGSHGLAVLNERNNLGLCGDIKSDAAPLNGLISSIREIKGIRCMKDLTRGGLLTAINEISESAGVGAVIDENNVPVSRSVSSASDVLGLDPFYIANEGKIVVVVDRKKADEVLSTMRRHKYGKKASVIGSFTSDKAVMIRTSIGSTRLAPMASGEQLPRIC